MRQQISKKIFLYFFLFFLLGTINNKFLNDFDLKKIKDINISGLDKNETIDFLKKLDSLKVDNLLFLDCFTRLLKSTSRVQIWFNLD